LRGAAKTLLESARVRAEKTIGECMVQVNGSLES
jgi:hypothetical protein